MKLHSLIPSLVLGAALAASAQTAAPGQPAKPMPAGKTEIAAVTRFELLDTAENGGLHHLRLLPGTLPQVVEQLQGACAKAAAEKGWSRETAEENLRKAKALVQQADAKAQGDGEWGIASKELSKAQALAEEAKEKGAAAKQAAEANLSMAQARLALARERVTAEREAAGEALRKALEFVMPNLTYGPGASEAKVSAVLDLAEVRPLDALALIAAAAGCELNPIYAPPQEEEGAGQRIIGYSFQLSPRRTSSSAPMPHAWKRVNDSLDSSYSVAFSPDGLTRTRFVVDPYSDPGSPPPAAGTPAPLVKANGAGPFDPEPLPRPAPPIPPPGKSEAGSTNPPPTVASATWLIPQQIDMNAQVVRIYALGSILGGNDPNIVANKVKEEEFNELVLETIKLAEAESPAPKLFFHDKSCVLIAKATLRQQEIIDQAVSAMKENEKLVNMSGVNALPQAKPPKP